MRLVMSVQGWCTGPEDGRGKRLAGANSSCISGWLAEEIVAIALLHRCTSICLAITLVMIIYYLVG